MICRRLGTDCFLDEKSNVAWIPSRKWTRRAWRNSRKAPTTEKRKVQSWREISARWRNPKTWRIISFVGLWNWRICITNLYGRIWKLCWDRDDWTLHPATRATKTVPSWGRWTWMNPEKASRQRTTRRCVASTNSINPPVRMQIYTKYAQKDIRRRRYATQTRRRYQRTKSGIDSADLEQSRIFVRLWRTYIAVHEPHDTACCIVLL